MRLNAEACLVLTLLAAGAGCSDGQAGQRASAREARKGQVTRTDQVQVTPTGALEGFVRLADGSRRAATRVRNTTDPEVCGPEHSLEDLVVSGGAGGVQHVTASLVGVSTATISTGPPQRLVIDNHECRFTPHVSVARVGDTIVSQNSDPVFHTTHYYGPLASNVGLPTQGVTVSRVVERTGVVIVLCDVHGWMKAFIRVNDHRFHAVSDGLGFLRIAGIPPGSYTLELWHETLGTQQVRVEIQADRTARVDIEYALPPSRP